MKPDPPPSDLGYQAKLARALAMQDDLQDLLTTLRKENAELRARVFALEHPELPPSEMRECPTCQKPYHLDLLSRVTGMCFNCRIRTSRR